MSRPRSQKRAAKPGKRSRNGRFGWLLIVLVLVAVLVILLRMAEFTGHRVQHGARRIAPAVLLP